MLMLGCKVVKSRKLLPLYFVLFLVVLVVNVVSPYHVTLSFLQPNNKGESSKPEFEAFTGSGKTLRQKRKN